MAKSEREKILYISQVYPYPADGGGKIKTLNTLVTLAKKYEIYAIFISERKPSKKEISYLENKGIKLKVFYNPKILDSVKDNYLKLFLKFVKGISHYEFQYTHQPAFSFIKNTINKYKPDTIHIDHINIAQYLPIKKNEVWVLESHNVEHHLLWTRFKKSKPLKRKLYLLIESTLSYLFEKKWVKKFDHIFMISDQDKIRYQKSFSIPKEKIFTQLPTYLPLKIKSEPLRNNILFIGGLGWPPNEDAVEWFALKILPLIQERIPNVKFNIVGKKHPPVVKKLKKSANTIIHGHQPSLRKFLKSASIFVLPFKMGGGVRLKALTALSASIPIVSTRVGIDGLKMINNLDYLNAETNKEFAEKCIALLKDEILQKKLSRNGRKYLKYYHSQKNNQKYLKKYQEILLSFIKP